MWTLALLWMHFEN
uniref:Uncharacterized protein n=1 Tax=Timema genevievae TaxID=629358 RepID=A0A7R9KBU7_TIMGE|nr:unnamed protein product [Timema genevievae]